MANKTWTDAELAGSVDAYLQMLRHEEAGIPYQKARFLAALKAGPLAQRSHKALEYRMMNISYVMQEMALPIIAGYKPAAHVGSGIAKRLRAIIEAKMQSGTTRIASQYPSTTSKAPRPSVTTEMRLKRVRKLERLACNADPIRKERVSARIERGSIGQAVKEARGGRCQICEALGQPAVAFTTPDGKPYAEAHHVHPVSKMLPGSLGVQNIMVLCPNHHRQAHYGQFRLIAEDENGWSIEIDQTVNIRIEKTTLE